LTVSGGHAPYTYNWSNGATTQDVSGLNAGSYCVTVADQCGQTAVICDTVTIADDLTPPVINCPSNIVLSNCSYEATYLATATDNCHLVGIQYSVPSGSTFPFGTTTVTATASDDAGNTASCSFTVTVTTDALTLSLSSPVDACGYNVSACCNSGNGGSGSGSGSGNGDHGSGLGGSGSDPGDQGSGSHGSEHQHDDHYCDRRTVNHGTGNGGSGSSRDDRGSGSGSGHLDHGHCGSGGNGSGNSVPCGSDGTIHSSVAGGCGPFTYQWSNGETAANLTGLTAGLYIVTVTDANGNTTTSSIALTQAAMLTVSTSATNVTCFGANNGTATVSGIGGCTPYTYRWSNNATTQTISGLRPGTYTVTIADGYGCTATATATVAQPSRLIADAGSHRVVYPAYAPQACATLVGTASGGAAGYTAVWRMSNGVVLGTGLSIQVCPTATTVYHLTITDANGCTARDSVAVCPRNISCGNNMVQICHTVPGRRPYSQTQCLNVAVVQQHLAHGDVLGACGARANCTFPRPQGNNGSGQANHHKAEEAGGATDGSQPELSMRAFPNPTSGALQVEVACRNCVEDGLYTLKVTDIYGQEILFTDVPVSAGEGSVKLDLTKYAAGVYLITLIDGEHRIVERVVRQ
jgi:hypothetical protein